jgi:hypothetical protein
MKWVTRDHVHMDRVASPWLIKRFIDAQAEFAFVPFGKEHPLPPDAIPFAVPGVELGMHDATGSTFRKLLRKYNLADAALEMLAEIIESGITHVFSQIERGYTDVAKLKYAEGVGLDALSQGMMYTAAGDLDDIAKSAVIYDALYAFCQGKLIEAERPELAKQPVPTKWDLIGSEIRKRAGERSQR